LNFIKNLKKFDDFISEKVYVGYIIKKEGKKLYAWTWDGRFEEFDTNEEAEKFKNEMINKSYDAMIFTKKEYNEIDKIRQQGQ
jgi:hypothetical protein